MKFRSFLLHSLLFGCFLIPAHADVTTVVHQSFEEMLKALPSFEYRIKINYQAERVGMKQDMHEEVRIQRDEVGRLLLEKDSSWVEGTHRLYFTPKAFYQAMPGKNFERMPPSAEHFNRRNRYANRWKELISTFAPVISVVEQSSNKASYSYRGAALASTQKRVTMEVKAAEGSVEWNAEYNVRTRNQLKLDLSRLAPLRPKPIPPFDLEDALPPSPHQRRSNIRVEVDERITRIGQIKQLRVQGLPQQES